MNEIINQIGICVERGKVNKISPYPKDLLGLDGADELTRQALENSVAPDTILTECSGGMHRIGEKFGRGQAFVPELLMSAKAMNAVMAHLKPFFKAGSVRTKGKFIIGTVAGDLHDIGKNLVAIIVEGNGWQVIDLGVDVKPEKFISAIRENPGCVVGLSALLTTTMVSMSKTIHEIKSIFPNTKIIVGGAPLTQEAADNMGADAYSANPQKALPVLEELVRT